MKLWHLCNHRNVAVNLVSPAHVKVKSEPDANYHSEEILSENVLTQKDLICVNLPDEENAKNDRSKKEQKVV